MPVRKFRPFPVLKQPKFPVYEALYKLNLAFLYREDRDWGHYGKVRLAILAKLKKKSNSTIATLHPPEMAGFLLLSLFLCLKYIR